MTQYNFKGDINNISEPQLEFINKIISERDFENSKVSFAPVGKAGDNYVAAVKRITIEGEYEKLTMIAKLAPTNELLRGFMNSGLLFKNEHMMYTEILPKLVQLQKDEGIPENDQLKYARCYGSFTEAPHEVILLEDLNTLGFTMLDRFVPLNDDCIKSILKNFAILHSLSYALKQKQPNVFEDFKANLGDMWIVLSNSPHMQMYFQSLEDQVAAVLESPDHINLVRHKINGCLDLAVKLTKVDNDIRNSVILQGDAWTNNFMFRFEDQILTESVMIDYQVSRNGSPVIDIMYLIFNCADYETRKKHFYEWIDYYYSELEISLSNFNLNANFVCPRDKLDADLKVYGKFLFGLSVMLSSVLIRKSEDSVKMRAMMGKMNSENMIQQMQEVSVESLDEQSINLFKNRVIGLVESFIEFGLF